MADRRRTQRVDCDFFLTKHEGGHPHLVRAVDLSLDGMAIHTLHSPLDDASCDVVKLEMQLPGGDRALSITATKVDQRDQIMRLRFVNLSHVDFLQLRGWVQHWLDPRRRSVRFQSLLRRASAERADQSIQKLARIHAHERIQIKRLHIAELQQLDHLQEGERHDLASFIAKLRAQAGPQTETELFVQHLADPADETAAAKFQEHTDARTLQSVLRTRHDLALEPVSEVSDDMIEDASPVEDVQSAA